MADTSLENHYALVTGGTRGIGLAIAALLAGRGCSVAVASRHAPQCEAVASELQARSRGRILGIACDVSIQTSVRTMFRELRAWSGDRLDTLVCNAGFPFLQELWNTPLDATPEDKLDEWYSGVFRTDTLGSVFCTYEALPVMIKQRSGSIVYISSTPALEGFQGAPYTVAKAGILGLMRDVAREYGRYNIRANALALGNILTPATYDQLDPETRDKFAAEAPLRRWGSPEEVARTVLFLASDMSSFLTGQAIVLDGGALRR